MARGFSAYPLDCLVCWFVRDPLTKRETLRDLKFRTYEYISKTIFFHVRLRGPASENCCIVSMQNFAWCVISLFSVFQIPMTRAGGGDTNICSYVCVFVNLLVRPRAPDYTKTGRDRKFGTHFSYEYI